MWLLYFFRLLLGGIRLSFPKSSSTHYIYYENSTDMAATSIHGTKQQFENTARRQQWTWLRSFGLTGTRARDQNGRRCLNACLS